MTDPNEPTAGNQGYINQSAGPGEAQIPPSDPEFADLFRRRNDAESINRNLDDTLFLRRAHSVGHRRQLVNLLGYALMVNSLTILEHQARSGRSPDRLAA